MFAYTSKLQLALSDKLRRVGLAAGAGVVLVIGAGFLLAALWTFLARNMGWGPLGASLAIGAALVVIGLICLLMARVERHPTPSTDELKTEVQEQLNLMADTALTKASAAADAALERASDKASHLMDRAEQKVHLVSDDLGYRANKLADNAEARVFGAARRLGDSTAARFGVSPQMSRRAGDTLRQVRGSNAAAFAPLLGALAIGITLASRFQDWRHRDEQEDRPEDWDDDLLDDRYDARDGHY